MPTKSATTRCSKNVLLGLCALMAVLMSACGSRLTIDNRLDEPIRFEAVYPRFAPDAALGSRLIDPSDPRNYEDTFFYGIAQPGLTAATASEHFARSGQHGRSPALSIFLWIGSTARTPTPDAEIVIVNPPVPPATCTLIIVRDPQGVLHIYARDERGNDLKCIKKMWIEPSSLQ